MRNYLLLLLFLCISSYGASQKMHRNYSFYPQEEGNVYYIHPQKGYESNEKGSIKNLTYDITYLSGKDSASYTFTYFSENVFKIDSVEISDITGNRIFCVPASMYYVQPKKKNWQHRASISIPYNILVDLYQNPASYSISLLGNKKVSYNIKPKIWEKQSKMISRIFEIVKYN